MFKKNTGKSTGMSGQLQSRPDLNALHQLLSQGLEKRGKQVSLSWRTPGQAFTLFLVCNVRGDPRWCLYTDETVRQLIFDYHSCDPLLVFNLVTSSTTQNQPKTRSPFLGGLSPSGKAKRQESEAQAHSSNPAADATLETEDAEAFQEDSAEYSYVDSETQSDIQSDIQSDTSEHLPVMPAVSSKTTANKQAANKQAAEQPSEQKVKAHDIKSSGESSGKPVDSKQPTTSVKPAESPMPLAWPMQSVETAWNSGVPSQPPAWSPPKAPAPDAHISAGEKSLVLKSRPIDGAVIQTVMMKLRRPDTGMFLYPAFLYFLEDEFFRNYRSNGNLSILIFDLKTIGNEDSTPQPLPSVSMVDAVLRMGEIKRNVDLLAHYDGDLFAAILPNTKTAGARIFANRIIETLTNIPLIRLPANHKLSLAFGAASMPEDFGDLGKLLGAAELALVQACTTNTPLVMYQDIRAKVAEPA